MLVGCSEETNWVTVGPRERPEYNVDRFEASVQGGRVLHVIGIYEGASNHDFGHHPGADVTINIDDQGGQDLYLAVSSYEPVRWHVTGPGAASVRKVLVAGYHRHTADGISSGQVINRSGRSVSNDVVEEGHEELRPKVPNYSPPETASPADRPIACTMTYAAPDGGGCEAGLRLTAQAQALFPATLGTFTGVHNAQSFTIHAHGAATRSLEPSKRSHSNPWSIDKAR